MSTTRGHFFCFVQFDGGIFPGKFCHVRENDNGRRGADQKTRSHPAPIRTGPSCRSARPLPQDHKRRRDNIRISSTKRDTGRPRSPATGLYTPVRVIYAGMSKEAIQGPGAADKVAHHTQRTHKTPKTQIFRVESAPGVVYNRNRNTTPNTAQEEKTNV